MSGRLTVSWLAGRMSGSALEARCCECARVIAATRFIECSECGPNTKRQISGPNPRSWPGLTAPAHRCMLPAVRARLHVHPGDPREPERAARLLTAALLRGFPRQRPVTLAVLSLGPQPGLTPTLWRPDGVCAPVVEAEGTPVQWVTLGDHEPGEALLHKCGRAGPVQGSELIERPSRDRRVALRVAGHRRPLSLLRE